MVEYIHERLASGRKLVIADFSIAGGRAELDGELGVAAVVPRTDCAWRERKWEVWLILGLQIYT